MSSVTEKLGEIISGVAVAELDNYVELRHRGRHVMAHLNQQNARSGEMGIILRRYGQEIVSRRVFWSVAQPWLRR